MGVWQLQEVKAHLSEVVRQCLEVGPQMLTVRGAEKVVMISKVDYEKLTGEKPNLYDFIRNSPLYGLELEFKRNKSKIRDVEL